MKSIYEKSLKGRVLNKEQFVEIVNQVTKTKKEKEELLKLVNKDFLENFDISIKDFATKKKTK